MEKTIREQLIELAEEEYKKFSSNLLPGINNILGVRIPALRKIAKQIAANDWRSYLEKASDEYFEEIMLQGMVIGYAKAELEEKLSYVKKFDPKINNWSVCDSFCSGLKITTKYKEQVWDFLKKYYSSNNEFELRFYVVMLIFYYIDDEYIQQVLDALNTIKHDGYYIKMAVAWAVSMCYVKLPIATTTFLINNDLDDFTYNKALQKITESLKVDQETKAVIRSMRRV